MSETPTRFLRNAMDRRAVLRSIPPLLTLPAISALTGCSTFSTSTIRYRMVVELNTPQGVRRGSSVVESFMRDGPRMAEAGGVTDELRGEAVSIRLPGGIFFALLGKIGQGDASNYFAHILSSALSRRQSEPPLSRRYSGGEWKAERKEFLQKRAMVILDENDYPTFAVFRDLRDPNSIVEVTSDNIADIFGGLVSVRRVLLRATTAEVTTGIATILPWIKGMQGRLLSGASHVSMSSPFSGQVGSDRISVGVYK